MNGYALLDFGNGRRLERFGDAIVDRPCPAAERVRSDDPAGWSRADFRFESDRKSPDTGRGRWIPSVPGPIEIPFDFMPGRSLFMQIRGTPFGHLGVFPEQQANWHRIGKAIETAAKKRDGIIRVLNLFAYTGGSSIAAALAGPNVEVAHVDSSKSAVARARSNAERNGISAGIRYVVEDVRKFAARELRRGKVYDAVILDPPTYGHGVKGETWKLADDLPELLELLAGLRSANPIFFLLTAHTPNVDAAGLRRLAHDAGLAGHFRAELLSPAIPSSSGRMLPSGSGLFLS